MLTGLDLGGLTLFAGSFSFAPLAQLTGTLTLHAQRDPDAMFLFQIGSAMTMASNSVVCMLNGSVRGVYWEVGSSATLGTSTLIWGCIIADQSITLNTTANILCGRAIALHAAVTIDTNTVSNECLVDSDGGRTGVYEPATLALLTSDVGDARIHAAAAIRALT